jgi:hypothetical protein
MAFAACSWRDAVERNDATMSGLYLQKGIATAFLTLVFFSGWTVL